MATKEDVAKGLLSIKAVFLKPDDPFTWASGIKSPIYCDNRLVLSYPEVRDLVEQAIADTVKRVSGGGDAHGHEYGGYRTRSPRSIDS